MKLKILFIWLTCLVAITSVSAINYEKDTTLTKDEIWENEVEIKGNILVSKGVTLVVKPGTKITFLKLPQPAYLEVRGKLIAQGTKDKPIIFTSNVKQAGSWQGLSFYRETEETSEEFSQQLAYVTLEYAQIAIKAERSLIKIEQSYFSKVDKGLQIIFRAKAVVTDSTFTEAATAIILERGGEVEASNNTFSFCQQAIEGNGTYTLTIKNNTFTQNNQGIHLANTSSATQIISNLFSQNKYGLIAEKRCQGEISHNRFLNNQYGIYLSSQGNLQISHNLFLKNQQAISCVRMAAAAILQNEISQNEIGISCFLGAYPKINQNNIHQNQTAIFLRFLSADWNEQSNIAVPPPKLDATQNWWGEEITKLLVTQGKDFNRSDIFDGYDAPYNQDHGHVFLTEKVIYENWLSEKVAGTYQESK